MTAEPRGDLPFEALLIFVVCMQTWYFCHSLQAMEGNGDPHCSYQKG